jgi:beta-glucuronidase
MDERFYAACDRTGILVWVEPMVYCYHPHKDQHGTLFACPDATRLACQIIREMIATARNHVSVSLYGIGNECNTEHPEAPVFFAALAKTAREQDPTRLLSYAALYGNVGPLADLVDVLGINSYFGWYGKIEGRIVPEGGQATAQPDGREPIDLARMRQMLDGVLKDRRDRLALLLTEFGADSIPGVHSASRDLWSEEYHADLLSEVLALAREYPQIVGTFPFCLTDYRDPSKPSNSGWNEINLKGLVTYERRRKAAFGAVQRAYSPCA